MSVRKYTAKQGFLFDWKEPRFNEDEQEHLYTSILFLGVNDSIDDYIEVEESAAINYYK